MEEAGNSPESIKTISAIDLKLMGEIKQKTKALAKALQKSNLSKAEMKKIVKKTYNFCQVLPEDKLCTNYRDLKHFADLLSQNPKAKEKLKKAAVDLIASLEKAVVAEKHTPEENAGGLSIYLPENGMLESYDRRDPTMKALLNPKQIYEKTDWAKGNQWDEFLQGLKEEN